MSIGFSEVQGEPGIHGRIESQENQVWWGPEILQLRDPFANIDATAVDSGNTPTSILRGGLVLGRLTASGKFVDYDPTAADGSEVAVAVLEHGLSILGSDAVAADKIGYVLIGGLLKAANLVGLDANARRQLSGRFIFDDDLPGVSGGSFAGGAFLRQQSKATDYTVVAADNLTEFVATAAADFTLPAIGKGYRFLFRQTADADLGVRSAEGENVIAPNNATADGVDFATASGKIGAACIVYSDFAGTSWIVQNVGGTTMTTIDA